MASKANPLDLKVSPFRQHGVDFVKLTEEQGNADCPFCGHERKWYCNPNTRLWDCKRCGRSGNLFDFLTQRHTQYEAEFKGRVAVDLRAHRGLQIGTLRAWGVGYSPLGEFYSIPTYRDVGGKLCNLQRYYTKTKRTLATSSGAVGWILPKEGLKGTARVWICEGAWDAMACWEAFRSAGVKDDVVGVAGANAMPNTFGFLDQKDVVVCFDHDEAGFQGSTRANTALNGVARTLSFIHWASDLPEGFDTRDFFNSVKRNGRDFVAGMKKMTKTGLPQWGTGPIPSPDGVTVQPVTPVPESTGKGLPRVDVLKAYRKWLHLPSDEPLDVLFGTLFANRFDGEPLWLFLVAPPGGTKSELIMSLIKDPNTYATTSLTPHSLISGANFGGGDPSLIPRLNGKVLAVKDFTTILAMNQVARDEIFGVLRDAYDGRTEKHFGNGVIRRYTSKFGIIAGVTPAIEQHSGNSVLGERFLKYMIPTVNTLRTGTATIRQALANLTHESQMREDLTTIAFQCLDRKIDPAKLPKVSVTLREKFIGVAQFVADMRGMVVREKYTGQVVFRPTAEVGTRLAKQLMKLAIGISLFKQEDEVSEETFITVLHVARDTAPDRVQDVIKCLFVRHEEDEYFGSKVISEWTHYPQATVLRLLQDMELLRLVTRNAKGEYRLSRALGELISGLGLYDTEAAWFQHAKTRKRGRGA